ncbi:MAG TPA: S8 family serine peptidase [Bdellovibrionales bacterium]|nr:S8 family serine peptidase [Bdellovibrionales bacterium]
MKVFWGLLAFWSAFASAAETRYVFKGLSGTPPGLNRMTFGLSNEQVARIRELSEGRVNFGDVYYVDADAGLTFVHQENLVGTIQPGVPPPVIEGVTGDPELTNQWWIEKLGVKNAWTMATGWGVTVADCDAGFYHDEPDLRANMLLQHRYDLSDTSEPLVVNDGPYAYHGTAVAAILAGVMNGAGTNGIAYESRLVPLQNYNYDNSDKLDKEEATAACILRAIATPSVDVIVLENQTANGSSETFIGTRDAVRLAHDAGMIVVGAAGNYSVELTEEVKDDTGSIIVGALFRNDNAATWSNFGSRVTVGAYGEDLWTLYGPNGLFGNFGGTSGATPQVAATVALMLEVNPELTPEQTRAILTETRVITTNNQNVGGLLQTDKAVMKAMETAVDTPAFLRKQEFRRKLMGILTNG